MLPFCTISVCSLWRLVGDGFPLAVRSLGWLARGLVLLCWSFQPATADPGYWQDHVRLTALSSMRVYDQDNLRQARLEVELCNLSDQPILLLDAELSLVFEIAGQEPIILSSARVMKEIAIPPRPGWLAPGRAIIPVEVVFGERDNRKTDRVLVQLFNLLAGAPAGDWLVVLRGKARVSKGGEGPLVATEERFRLELYPVHRQGIAIR